MLKTGGRITRHLPHRVDEGEGLRCQRACVSRLTRVGFGEEVPLLRIGLQAVTLTVSVDHGVAGDVPGCQYREPDDQATENIVEAATEIP